MLGGGVDLDPRPAVRAVPPGRPVYHEGPRPRVAQQSFKLPWNDLEFLERSLEQYGEQVALVIMEPINANGGSC